MNKKMRELQAQITAKTAEAQALAAVENKDLDKINGVLDEVDALQKEFDTEKRLLEKSKANVPEVQDTDKKVDGFALMTKMANKQSLNDTEKTALITGADAANGENYLVPEDVKVAINELRKTYISARDIVTVETTDALSGSVNYEDGAPVGLTAFDDGDDIAEDAGPNFKKIPFAIRHFGKLIPVSRILLGAEKAGLMSYLNRWFVKNAVITENQDIFAKLKAGYNGGTPKAVSGWKALKKSINVDLDPSCLVDGVLVTNQSGFAVLDEEEDNNGRPILQENPANRTQKLFQGLVVKVYPDAQLPNIDATHFPVFYGATKAGCTLVEHSALEFATSEHFRFGKNQNTLRVIEGFDTMSTDTTAYIYGSFTAGTKA